MFSVIDINTYVAEAKQSRAMPEEVCRRACGPCGMGERQQMVKESVELRGREGGREGERKQACQLTMHQGLAI